MNTSMIREPATPNSRLCWITSAMKLGNMRRQFEGPLVNGAQGLQVPPQRLALEKRPGSPGNIRPHLGRLFDHGIAHGIGDADGRFFGGRRLRLVRRQHDRAEQRHQEDRCGNKADSFASTEGNLSLDGLTLFRQH